MFETSSPPPDPQDSCVQIMRAVRSSGLTWGTQETPYSIFLTIRKRFLKNAKNISNTARPPTHTLGVVRGNQQYEQLLATHKESQLTIQNLESGMGMLKSDLEGEVNNGEQLKNSLCVSKALVNTLNIKYAEFIEQLKQSAKTVEDHDNIAKALKKAKAEVTRLTSKNDEAQNTIAKLRETMRQSFSEKEHNELLQKKYYLENEVSEANQKASLAEEEVFMYKVNNSKLSEQNTKLMIALANSKGSQDSLEKQLSEAVALGSYELTEEPSSSPAATGFTPKLLSKS
jgi:hypothetical protein